MSIPLNIRCIENKGGVCVSLRERHISNTNAHMCLMNRKICNPYYCMRQLAPTFKSHSHRSHISHDKRRYMHMMDWPRIRRDLKRAWNAGIADETAASAISAPRSVAPCRDDQWQCHWARPTLSCHPEHERAKHTQKTQNKCHVTIGYSGLPPQSSCSTELEQQPTAPASPCALRVDTLGTCTLRPRCLEVLVCLRELTDGPDSTKVGVRSIAPFAVNCVSGHDEDV